MLIRRNNFAVLSSVLYLCAAALGDDGVVQIQGTIGQEVIFDMPIPTNVAQCYVTSNTGVQFSLYPDISERPPEIDQSFTHETDKTCGMRILSPTIEHAGLWTIRAIAELNNVETETIGRFELTFLETVTEVEEETEDDIEPEVDSDIEDETEEVVNSINGIIGQEVNFDMPTPTNVAQCYVTSNTGVEFSLYPDISERPPEIDQSFTHQIQQTCGMRILSPTIEHAGLWTIRAITESNGVEHETVGRFQLELTTSDDELESQSEITEKVDVFPSRTINVFPGYSMSLRMLNHYEDLTSCIATAPDGQKFDVLNTVENFHDEIRPFDQCGVTVRVNSSHAGTWRLDATIDNDGNEKFNYFGNFNVIVKNSSAVDTATTITYVQRGAPASLAVGPSNAVSCWLRSPSGQDWPLQSGRCQIDIPIVTYAHEGFWTASYSLDGKVDTIEQQAKVIAYEDHDLNATVTKTKDGQVHLLCSVRSYSFSFCQFVKPDGEVLNIFEGIGNDGYLYHGNGTQSTSMLTQRTHQCGITISVPTIHDYGTWKCILGTDSGLTGSMLRVSLIGQNGYENAAALNSHDTVYVVKGDSLTIKCQADAPLKYCWMRSPNGISYSVSSTGNSSTTLRYEGMGLSLGECGAVIPAAEYTDEGQWNCWMGISSEEEVRTTVDVFVTDTPLYPGVKNVTIRRNRAELACYIIPRSDESIDYCRWMKPDGSGIEISQNRRTKDPKYYAYGWDKSCHLIIEGDRISQDIGEWTCVAGLVTSGVEASATIRVIQNQRSSQGSSKALSWSFGIGLSIISIIIAMFFIAMIHSKRQSRKSKPDLPPKYEETQTVTPPPTNLYEQP